MKKVIKEKSKSRIKTKSKILVLGLILIIAAGFFISVQNVSAQEVKRACYDGDFFFVSGVTDETDCKSRGADHHWWTSAEAAAALTASRQRDPSKKMCFDSKGFSTSATTETECLTPAGNGNVWRTAAEQAAANATISANQSPFDAAVNLSKNSCNVTPVGGGSFVGCILQFVYWTFYTLGAWLLAIAASFFNYFIKITLGPELLKSDFVSHAWGVVRDLSNIFFILILLFIAIKIILDLGGSEAKKMIAKVIIIALLINFSMFFTHVVIDSSNILALIFYNKLNTVDEKNPNKAEQLIDYATGQKDLAGGLTQSFNPVYKLDNKFFTEAKEIRIPGRPPIKEPVSTGTLIGITVIAGAIMLFAAYALFISALAFLGRLIELFVLIIFSPFAFMSFAVPKLAGIEYLGWGAWSKRLLTVSFMAPIFMFFLYFIFLLLGESEGKNMFTDSLKGEGMVRTLLSIIIPAMVVLILLLKATEFAKKGSGTFGEAIIKGGKMVAGVAGGLALGAATGGAGFALRAGIGGVGGTLANKTASGVNWLAKKDSWIGKGARGLGANRIDSGLTYAGALAQRSSFDLRAGGGLAKMTGLSIGQAQKGGREQARKDKVEKRQKRANMLKVRDDESISKKIRAKEMDLQVMLNKVAGDFHTLDEAIKDKRQDKRDETDPVEKRRITNEIKELLAVKKTIKSGGVATLAAGKLGAGSAARTFTGPTQNGETIKSLSNSNNGIITELKNKKELESRRRTTAFAKRTGRWYKGSANKQAKYEIIMESKIATPGEDHST